MFLCDWEDEWVGILERQPRPRLQVQTFAVSPRLSPLHPKTFEDTSTKAMSARFAGANLIIKPIYVVHNVGYR